MVKQVSSQDRNRRIRKPNLSAEQIQAAINYLENAGKPKPKPRRRGKGLGEAVEQAFGRR